MASASTWTQDSVVGFASIWQAAPNLVDRLVPVLETDLHLAVRRERFRRALRRLCDALLWIVAAAWLSQSWGVDILNPAPGRFARLVARPALGAAATIVAVWILWTALSAVIDEKMPHMGMPGDGDEAGAASVSRLATLLPLLRNVVLVGLIILAVIVGGNREEQSPQQDCEQRHGGKRQRKPNRRRAQPRRQSGTRDLALATIEEAAHGPPDQCREGNAEESDDPKPYGRNRRPSCASTRSAQCRGARRKCGTAQSAWPVARPNARRELGCRRCGRGRVTAVDCAPLAARSAISPRT